MEIYFICSANNCPHRGVLRSVFIHTTPANTENEDGEVTDAGDVVVAGDIFCDGGGTPHSVGFAFPDAEEVMFRFQRRHDILNTWREDWGV